MRKSDDSFAKAIRMQGMFRGLYNSHTTVCDTLLQQSTSNMAAVNDIYSKQGDVIVTPRARMGRGLGKDHA